MEDNERKIYDIFKELGISEYKVHEHKAIFTAQEAEDEGLILPGLNLKNLLVKDKKTELFYMIILEDHRHMDEKHFKEVTGWSKIRFAREEEMWELLKLKPGSVSPFGLINDVEHKVNVVLEELITNASENELVNFHPNRNNATLSLKKKDFIKFLNFLKVNIIWER